MSVPSHQPASDPSDQPGAAGTLGRSEAASQGQWFAPLCGRATGADPAAVTRPAASAALASMRSLAEHPAVAAALAGGQISVSWARQIAEWTGLLPAECRGGADVILLAAAAGGADLAGLAELAEEIRRRTARPDRDGDGGFADRAVRLATTLGGAGKLHGELTGGCAAALQAVLDCLGKKAGPEDTRSLAQRHHDAMEEMCRRLLAAGTLPDRAGPGSPSASSST